MLMSSVRSRQCPPFWHGWWSLHDKPNNWQERWWFVIERYSWQYPSIRLVSTYCIDSANQTSPMSKSIECLFHSPLAGRSHGYYTDWTNMFPMISSYWYPVNLHASFLYKSDWLVSPCITTTDTTYRYHRMDAEIRSEVHSTDRDRNRRNRQ
jgi:hypothetical protein